MLLAKRKGHLTVDRKASARIHECLVLLSGGIDSAACVSFYILMERPVVGLFVDYGQPARLRERRSARALARHYGIELLEISCRGFEIPKGEIPGRNGFLVLAALMVGMRPTVIALGIHGGTPYFDCSPAFAKEVDGLVQEYTSGTTALGTPFLRWEKSAVLAFARAQKVPLKLTWSCELGRPRPCERCRSCRDRKALCC